MSEIKNFLYAISVLIGTIIGAGVFGLPYTALKAGFLTTFFYLIILGAITLIIHLFYNEIVLKTQGKHRLVGYAEKYLNKKAKHLTGFSSIIGRFGAILAYIIVGGYFLNSLFNHGSAFFWSLIFFLIGSLFIFLGLKTIAKVELLMILFLLIAMGSIFVFAWPKIELTNLISINFSNLFLPYGVVLFSLGGATAIPEMRELLKPKKLKLAIILGTIIPIFLFIIFIIAVLGASGSQTSSEALKGLQNVLGKPVMIIGLVFGVLALMTSFLTIGLSLKKIFWYDYKLNKHFSWVLVCFIPLFFYLIGFRDFIAVIGIIGTVMGGISGTIICLIYGKLKKSWLLPGLVMLVFLLGIISLFL